MFRFETLDIWKMAIDFCDKTYHLVEKFPQKVQYNLGSQLRNSALSISNNIAEGSGSSSKREFKNFLNYSIRSTFETVSALVIARNRKYLSVNDFDTLYSQAEILVKKIHKFRQTL